MKKTILAAAVASAFTGAAFADDAAAPAAPYTLTANVGVVSDYLFRGITQSGHKPAIQGGVDFTHSSGLYVGTWLSSISWVHDNGYGNSPTEIDVYGGYRGTFADDYGYDVGLITYNYPGSSNAERNGLTKPFTAEVYGQLSWKFLSVKDSYTVSKNFVGFGLPASANGGSDLDSRGSNYIEANLAYDLGDGWGVSAHVGHQTIRNSGFSDPNYTDWNIGGTKDVGFGVVGLKYSGTNANRFSGWNWGGRDNNDAYDASRNVLLASFTKTF